MSEVPRHILIEEHATLSFLVSNVYRKETGNRLSIEHSLGDGFFYVDSKNIEITEEIIKKVEAKMRLLLDSDENITFSLVPCDDLVKKFSDLPDKLGLLKTWADDVFPCIQFGEFLDFQLEPMSAVKERLKIFELRSYRKGLLLRFANILHADSVKEWNDPKELYKFFQEFHEWSNLMNCHTISDLNTFIYNGKINDLKWVAELLHEQKLAHIAKTLTKNLKTSPNRRIVTIAGPSSSNKTTFAKRLQIQLLVNGHKALYIGMDDYYKNRNDIPFEKDGQQNFEAITALNLDVLGETIRHLLEGKKYPKRIFDFITGIGSYSETEFLELKNDMFLVIEGIHGLNPLLLNTFGRKNVSTIYISALTTLKFDLNHRFPTSDLRLLRRIIRDFQFRGYSSRKTIERWTSVRVGEEENIFPFQGNADFFFNSSLVYEIPVLSLMGKTLLAEASITPSDEDPTTPQSIEVTKEARRLLGFLNFFYPMMPEAVPHISCLREFIGGSEIEY